MSADPREDSASREILSYAAVMSSGDPGLHILLSVQLLLSLLAMWAWWRVSRDEKASLKRASQVSAAWFAFIAVLIAYLYDVGILY